MLLLKFIDVFGANNFLKGNLRFGLVKDYRNLENNIIMGKRDSEEGRFFTEKYVTPSGSPMKFRLESNEDVGHVLCLYHMGDKLDAKGLRKMAEFGDYVVIIKDEQEFIRRIDIAVKGEGYTFLRRDVFYYDESVEDEMNAMKLLSSGKEYFSFLKREKYFSFQKEYRYLIIDADTNNNVKWIKVGDLKDIAEIQSTEKFLKGVGVDSSVD